MSEQDTYWVVLAAKFIVVGGSVLAACAFLSLCIAGIWFAVSRS